MTRQLKAPAYRLAMKMCIRDSVEGAHGKGGGYRLCRAPEEYSVREILELSLIHILRLRLHLSVKSLLFLR